MPIGPLQSESWGDELWALVNSTYRPAFAVFHGDGYGQPCAVMATALEQAKDVFGEAIRIAEFDAAFNRAIATGEAIMTLPTTLFFNDGKEISRLEGFPGTEPTLQWMTEQLSALGIKRP